VSRDKCFANVGTRYDLDAASHLLTQLTPSESGPVIDPELAFQISLLKIDYLQRLGTYNEALAAIESLAQRLKEEDADMYQRIHLLVMKALLFSKVGKPEKGFTVAIRAANAAWQSKIVPALWEAWGCVANILGSLDEFDAERRILDAIMPQVECSCLQSSRIHANTVYSGIVFWRLGSMRSTIHLAGRCVHGACRSSTR
jgi:anaphase-promoting complex subunit 5